MALFASILLILLVFGLIGIYFYNSLVRMKVQVNEGWSDIQIQLKRRHNMIGNLVETVKGYASHEQETLDKIIQARTAAQAQEGQGMAAIVPAEAALTTALQGLRINALTEAYPELKANEGFLKLQDELTDIEDKIAASRRYYNTTVTNLNAAIEQFPSKLFANAAGATKQPFFEVELDQEIRKVPTVAFTEEKKATTKPEAAPAPAPEQGQKDEQPAPEAPAKPAAQNEVSEEQSSEPTEESTPTTEEAPQTPAPVKSTPEETPETPATEETPTPEEVPSPESPQQEEVVATPTPNTPESSPSQGAESSEAPAAEPETKKEAPEAASEEAPEERSQEASEEPKKEDSSN